MTATTSARVAAIVLALLVPSALTFSDIHGPVALTKSPLATPYTSESNYRLALSGPFFTRSAQDHLVIETIGLPYHHRAVFYREERHIGTITDSAIEIVGTCLSPRTHLLSVLANIWHGAPTIPGGLFVVSYDRDAGLISVDEVRDVVPDGASWTEGVVSCADGQKPWVEPQIGAPKKFVPCECTYQDLWAYDSVARELEHMIRPTVDPSSDLVIGVFPSEFFGGKNVYLPGSGGVVSERSFSRFLLKVSELPVDSGFSVVQRQSEEYKVVTITYSRGVYDSFQYVLTRHREQDYWTPLFAAGKSSKGFNTAQTMNFMDPITVRVEMCIEGCQWSGEYGIVDFNLATREATIVARIDRNLNSEP